MNCKPETPAWVGITYLIYLIVFDGGILLGAGYAVFVLGNSGWWMLAAIVICTLGWKPHKWHSLWTGNDPDEGKKP